MKVISLFLIACLLSSCGTIALKKELDANPDEDILAAIQNVTIVDAQAALDDANAHNDQIAAACWAAVGDFAKNFKKPDPSANTGALLAIQKIRDGMGSESLVDPKLRIGCAALVNDMKRKGLALAAMIAAYSKGGPAAGQAIGAILH